MKKSTKAVLLSALVFPGAGHLYLKRYLAGGTLAATSFACLYYLIANAVEKALAIVEQIQNGEVQMDPVAITELASRQPGGTEAFLLDVSTYAIIILWLFGIFDSYRRGRLSDNQQQAQDKK